MSLPQADYVASPCVKVCALDARSGLCRGCFRTLQEIADWLEMTAEAKRATLERAAERARAEEAR